ncbi:MAG TPA: DUF4139 domain-containing protein [Candidatus Limnocylindrales bacterium]|nr:DUF4139 domain-containing protein [Candidatus Limnocylindrales bacterium]
MDSRASRISGIAILVMAIGALVLAASPARAQSAAGKEEEAANVHSTTEKDQVDLSLTVYNSNIALVRDVRQIRLPAGTFPLHFEDVAATINPATVHFRSLNDPSKLNVVEQNYEYDLLDPQKLLQKYVGREVTLVRQEKDAGSTRWVETKALLLADNGGPVWKIGNEIVTGMSADSYRFPDLPENLYSRPTLVWLLENRGAPAQKVEASYLANSINWSADYVLTVGRDEKGADLDGWVTLTSASGVAYNNAKLQLVAGELHRTQPPMPRAEMAAALEVRKANAAQFAQEAFSEYHLYTLERRTSIQNNESKQISLLTASNVPVEKSLVVEGEQYYYRNPQGMGNAVPQTVKVYYQFKNEEKANLGMPLPAGTVRVYQSDSKGGVQFVGEDLINHTPKDEKVRVYVGNAFDVVCERKQMDYKKLASNLYEMEYQITLRNHKDGAVTVDVREPLGGDWEVVNSNFKWTKLDARTIGFQIPVEKNGTATLDYRVRVKW